MKKTIQYRLFGLGAIPGKLRPVLASEGIVAEDEGMGGWLVTKDVKGPGKRYFNRTEGFSGCLVVTRKRIVCYTYGKRQIHISVEDPKIPKLHVTVPVADTLSVSFESSDFRTGWSGEIELRFKTQKALQFRDVLKSLGVR